MRVLQLVLNRTFVVAVAAAAAVGGIAVVGANQGNPVQDVKLLSGAAWFSSAKVGQVTLLDGISAEVAAQVQVAPAGNTLEVVQQGATAYAIDETAGTVRRVDGATFDMTAPLAPIPDARTGLTAIPGPDSLYTLDTKRGILASTDPHTLARRGEMLSLASQLTAGTATVDNAGTLWAVDNATGDLNRVAGESRTVRRKTAKPGNSIVAIAANHPVIVDTADRKVISVDRDTGRTDGAFDLDLRPDDKIQVSGSRHAERLYVVVGRGTLNICELAAQHCDNAIPLNVGSEFGPAVEAGSRLFVPDYTTGQVWIVDLTSSQVIAKPTVLKPNVKFQLLSRDGLVFYNDTNSEQAGVIQLDGTITTVKKYDPLNPDKGVNQPSTGNQQEQPPATQQAGRTTSASPNLPQPGPQDPKPNRPQSDDGPKPANPDPQNPNNPGDTQPLRLKVSVTKASPTVNEPIELNVQDEAGGTIKEAHWTFGDGAEGNGESTSHMWAAARENPYIVTVEVTMTNGQRAVKSVNITVGEKPKFTLQVEIPGGGGTVSGGNGDIKCPSTCVANFEPDTQLTLTAQPDASHLAGTWDGACKGSTTATCDVTMDQAKTVTYTFKTPDPTVTLRVDAPNGGTITGSNGINCPGQCSATVKKGTKIQLTGNPAQLNKFGGWGGVCAGTTGANCAVTLNDNGNVMAVFPAKIKVYLTIEVKPRALPPAPAGKGQVTGPGGMLCRDNCQYEFLEGDKVEITGTGAGVIGDRLHYFHDWGGDTCSGEVKTCTVYMTKDWKAVAYFAQTAA